MLALACWTVCCLLVMSGCKVSEDATAASTQMASTCKALSGYYAALGQTMDSTIRANEAQYAVLGVPFDAATRKQMEDVKKELEKRSAMADELAKVSTLFSKLTGSSSAEDSAAAVGKLDDELVALSLIAENDGAETALKQGVKLIVTLVQEHKEKEAAQKMEPLAKDLSAFFDSEKATYDSIDHAYLVLAASTAQALLDKGQVDEGSFLRPVLKPFGLTANLTSDEVKAGMKGYVREQIVAKTAEQQAIYDKASAGMSDSLKEMSRRISVVVADKPMPFRGNPISLEDVMKWVDEMSQ